MSIALSHYVLKNLSKVFKLPTHTFSKKARFPEVLTKTYSNQLKIPHNVLFEVKRLFFITLMTGPNGLYYPVSLPLMTDSPTYQHTCI